MRLYQIDEKQGRRAVRLLGNDTLLHRAPDAPKLLVSAGTAAHLSSNAVARRGGRSVSAALAPLEPPRSGWDEARSRLILGWAAAVSDPLPAAVLREIQLYLYARPGVRVEYMGRGVSAARDPRAPGNEKMFHLDIAGGRRHYFFREVNAPGEADGRLAAMRETMDDFRSWLNDPNAKLVLSLGGGGFRMFAATTILKVLERLIDGDRARVAEVWGSSGGAFVGNVFSSGFDLDVLDDLGYDLYHDRDPRLVNGSTRSLLRMKIAETVGALRRRDQEPVVAHWLRALEDRQPAHQRRQPALPFYSVAANTRHKGLCALAEPAYIPDDCRDILFPCDRVSAVAASTAVPFLLRAQRGITAQGGGDTWIDGSINDENPILLPYIKWSRERERRLAQAPERLKILLVDLNLRSSESPTIRALARVPLVRKYTPLPQAVRLIDMLLDSRMHATLQMLTENPSVSIRCLKLNLGTLSFKNPADIPSVIHRGRQREAWQLTTYKRGI